jgi:mannose/cellobiose epimerase-like protein (N-acyl-D-glucosamine 2-epimerase family)|tara:strand:+ start:111 stop:359 length:249 start_codon:yes stop_codon:yes gene_type:complete
MSEEPDEETQAEMALKLSDNVQHLVRLHIVKAFEDYAFMANLSYNAKEHLAQAMYSNLQYTPNRDFEEAVKKIIRESITKIL